MGTRDRPIPPIVVLRDTRTLKTSARPVEVLPHLDAVLRRSRSRDILAVIVKIGLALLSAVGALAGFAAADELRIPVLVGLLVGLLPPVIVAAVLVGGYQFYIVPKFKRNLRDRQGMPLDQFLNDLSLNPLANAAAADDCLFAKCLFEHGYTRHALRVARSSDKLSEPLKPLPTGFALVRIDESDAEFAALAEKAGYTFDRSRKSRPLRIGLVVGVLFLGLFMTWLAWGEDPVVVGVAIAGTAVCTALAILPNYVRFGGRSTEAHMMPCLIAIREPRDRHGYQFAETDSLLIWWIDRGRLTLANAWSAKSIRVTRLEGELTLRAWYGGHGAAVGT